MTILSDDVTSRLGEFITARFGLRFPPDRWNDLERGVASAALELGCPDLRGWVDELLSGAVPPEELAALANHLTIGETYFFRQREMFNLLGESILPERFELGRARGRPVRIWSAACSSGEEPYSIAMLIQRTRPARAEGTVAIFGTDINSHVLERAARGIYSEWSFRDTPRWLKESCFTRQRNGRYEISPETRRMVNFSTLNLAQPLYPPGFDESGEFDVILCRNALMYFSAEWQQEILRRLCQALAPGGCLIVSPCDISTAQGSELNLSQRGTGVFEKRGADAAQAATQVGVGGTEEVSIAPAIWLVPVALTEAAPRSAAVWLDVPVIAAEPEGDVDATPAHWHANRGELALALAACDAAIGLEQTNPQSHYLRACILQEANRLSEAAESFRRVLYLDPKSVMAEFALACLAERQERRDDARRHFANVLRLLDGSNRGESVPGADGLTVGRLRVVVERNLVNNAA